MAAARNAVIFSLVEQVLGDNTGKKQKLEVISNSIELYDKHVDALGHAACMDAVKRYLATEVAVPGALGPHVTAEVVGHKHPDHHTKKLLGVDGTHGHQHEKGTKKGKNKGKNGCSLGGVLKYVGHLAGEIHFGEKFKYHKLNLDHIRAAHPFPAKLEKDEKLTAEQSKERHMANLKARFHQIEHIITKHKTDTALFVNTDEDTAKLVAEGRHFFHPVGYNRLKKSEKKTVKHDTKNWSNPGTAQQYKEHKAAVRGKQATLKEGEIYAPQLSNGWDKMSGQEKFVFLVNEKHWNVYNKEGYEADKKAMMNQ